MLSIHYTEADRREVEREMCRRSLATFAKRAWHVLEPAAELKWGWVLDAICLHLEAVTRGDIKRLLINVPPGTMKSLLTSVIWPAWEWGPAGLPHMRIVSTAHKMSLCLRDSRKCRGLILSDWYQGLWPIKLDGSQASVISFANSDTGFREASPFSSITGTRGDRVILDDPLSVASANSAADLESTRVAFVEGLPTRVNNADSAIVVIMQRLNERDTSGVILGQGLNYEHLCIPMEFEPDRRCTTSIGWSDPRTEPGELMFPERFSRKDVEELKRTLGTHAVAGQLQQRPSPRGGGVFKTKWLQFYTHPPQLEWRMIFADTAQKTSEVNDYSVLQCWGRSISGQAVFLDQIRGKWEAPELLMQARAFWNKHRSEAGANGRGTLRGMRVEDKISGTGLIQTMRREGMPVIPIPRRKDKITRAYDVAPFLESGNVMVPMDAAWLSDFMAEYEAFPAGAHEDQIDPMLDAIRAVQDEPSSVRGNPGVPLTVLRMPTTTGRGR